MKKLKVISQMSWMVWFRSIAPLGCWSYPISHYCSCMCTPGTTPVHQETSLITASAFVDRWGKNILVWQDFSSLSSCPRWCLLLLEEFLPGSTACSQESIDDRASDSNTKYTQYNLCGPDCFIRGWTGQLCTLSLGRIKQQGKIQYH